jgi:hypothetical protein
MYCWGAFVQPLLSWQSDKCYTFWGCFCSRRYPACNAHAPYCHLWPVRLYNIFPHYLINGTIFDKRKLFNIKSVFGPFLQHLSETFPILRRTEQDITINVFRSSCKVPVILDILQRNLKTDRQTDRRMDGRSTEKLIVAFRNFAHVPANACCVFSRKFSHFWNLLNAIKG